SSRVVIAAAAAGNADVGVSEAARTAHKLLTPRTKASRFAPLFCALFPKLSLLLVPLERATIYFGVVRALLALSSLSLTRVPSEFAWAFSTQSLQQRNTGCPLSITLTGVPIAPSWFAGWIGQNCCCSASFRSSGGSSARESLIALVLVRKRQLIAP